MTHQILVTTSLTPNILMHIFSCLEVEGSFYNSEYGLKHHFTILEEEYKEWTELTKKCMTLNCNVELYAALFQIPSYIPAEDIEMILDSYDNIIAAINDGSMENLVASYPGVFDNLPIYAPMSIFDNHFKKLNEHKEIIGSIIVKFKKIIQGVWDRFYQEYWTTRGNETIEKRINDLSVILSPINIISAWKKKLLIDFPYPEFTICLVEPTTAIASNLLAEKIMVSLNQEEIDLYKIIIHEVGRAFLLNINIFENEKLKPIAQSNLEKLSVIVDAAIVHIKKELFKTFKIKDVFDIYNANDVTEIVPIFGQIWDTMSETNIYEAIIQTYNKLTPVV
ncbi:MAG: hypothetical protein ACTSSH_00975 [Candidatus Heimdallarchaeota archaeon]